MLRAIFLAIFILGTGCGPGFDPSDRRSGIGSGKSKTKSKVILAYEVKRRAGESLKAISQRFHVPLTVIERFNPRAGQGRRSPIIYVPISRAVAMKTSNQKAAPIVKLQRDSFLRPTKVGSWSALEQEEFHDLDEWFLPEEDQRLSFPVEGYISSGFSWRWNRFHKGLDIAARAGTPIVAAQDGQVAFRGWRRGFGLLVIIQHKQGRTFYAHCQSTRVKAGQAVSRGDLIAAVGATGQSRGPHLHFEYRDDQNQPIDPTPFLQPPCSRPVALSAQPGRALVGMTSWSAKSTPCQSSDM